MIRIRLLFLPLFFIAFNINAQDNPTLFREYFQSGDTAKQIELLNKWKEESPNDAELFTCLFNYYFIKSKNEIITINSGTPSNGSNAWLLKDSADQIAGFIGSHINYDQSNLKQAFESLDMGIISYPNRLDMRFGKIYALGQIKDWRSFTDEIIKTIDYSVVNNNNWTWTNNRKYDGGKEEFLASLQDYQNQLYNTMNDSLLLNMQEISRAILNHYPSHLESMSNLAITYLIGKDFDKALEFLHKAEKMNAEDFIVLNNIAYAYKELGDKLKAINYYEKVLQFGDDQAKSQAEAEIKKLQE